VSTVLHYKSNLRDIFFNLFEFHDIGKTSLGNGPFVSMDESSAREALTAYEELCTTEIASSWADADREGLTVSKDGEVTLPKSLKKTLKAWYDNEWFRLQLPESLDGYGAPPSVNWAGFELTAGANSSAAFYLFGTVMARIVERLGTEHQKKLFLHGLAEDRWGGSMVLTEPDAGSDVGAGRAKATQIDGDIWEIEGTKRFITNGDYDGPPNIVHMVLARPVGAEIGTKGLSLFIVPKFWVNDDGSIGERNGVRVSKVEKKMGIKASATCEMVFGDGDVPARGYLMGGVHDGIRQMFHIIEHARMAVGVKSMATLSTAYLNALAYAKERVQGADLKQAADKRAPRVRTIQHPDVRRMLMEQKSHSEGMRALALYIAWLQDQVEILGGHTNKDAAKMDARNDLMLPLLKGYCSEKATEMLVLSLQTIGGSGYIQDFPFEQYLRDQKIDSLYEGTTHIQALDLFFRKIARDGGQTLGGLMEEAMATAQGHEGGEALANERAALLKALGEVQGIMMAMLAKLNDSVYHVGIHGNKVLYALAETVIAWLLVRHAAIAVHKLPGAKGADVAFYQGKIASAKWFCSQVLPGLTLTRKLIENSELSIMDVPEEAF
jgi:alkylation response protein AidB-like acyl-CoA dehydrogenase